MVDGKKNVPPDSVKEFDRVYNEHSTLILNIAYKYLRDEYLAEDVAQEVMLRYFIHREDKDITFEKNWLVKITRNLCLNILKKQKHEVASEEIELVSDLNEQQETEILSAEYQFMENQYQSELRDLCEEIFKDLEDNKEQWYIAMNEVYRNERPERDIAKELGMSDGSFYTMVCRIKQKLRKKYMNRYNTIRKT